MGEEEIITGPVKSKIPTAIKVILGLVLLLVVVLIAYVISSKSDCNKPISQDGYIIDNSIIPSSIAEGVDQQAISGVQCAFAYPETIITGSCAIGGSPYTLNGCTTDPCYNVRCEPSNDCKTAGTCINGTCSAETNKPDNTQCGDGSTTGDVCISGVCGGCVAPTSQRGYNITSITPSSIDYIFGGGAPQPVNGVTCDADAGWSRITDVEDPLFRLAHPDAGIPITGTCRTTGTPYILGGCEQVSNPGADAMTQRPDESSAEFYRRRTETFSTRPRQPVKWIRGESDETCTQTCSGATGSTGQSMTCQDGDWGVHDPVTMRRVLEQVENLPAGISSSCPLQGGSHDTHEGRSNRQSYGLTIQHGGYDMLELLPGVSLSTLNCLYDWDHPQQASCDGSPQDIGAPRYNRLCKCVNV
jgi:hypothetical protein